MTISPYWCLISLAGEHLNLLEEIKVWIQVYTNNESKYLIKHDESKYIQINFL